MYEKLSFSPSVIEQIGYYVYSLIDPETLQVFYIGKGTGNRIFAHANAAIDAVDGTEKLDKIHQIRRQGTEVDHRIIRHGLTEKEAFEVESALIDFVGLTSLTNIVQGHHADYRGMMTVREVIARYEAPEAHFSEPLILITVNKLFRRGMSEQELYDSTRCSWVIGMRRHKARYACALFNGIIRQVYRIERWVPSHMPGRWCFEGEIAAEMQHLVGSSTQLRSQNPIRYVNC